MDVTYKRTKPYDTTKKPMRQNWFWMGLIYILSFFALLGKKHKLEKINMDGVKPPYLLLSNHMCFIDFELAAKLTFPHGVNNVVNIDGYYQRPWLMELIGCVCTRKFTTDLPLVRNIYKVLKRGDILCLYPEARYSPIGTTAFLPDTLGSLVKRAKVPLVVIKHHGNYLYAPFWNFRRKRKVPLYTTMTQVLTADEVAKMTADEINAVIKEAMWYDEYKYQKDNGIMITEPYRAEGLHKVLYKCPNCLNESKMSSAGAEIFCTECGKRWRLNEDGTLTALSGKTEFDHIPSWFEWERAEVRAEIERGEYSYTDTVEIYSQPHCWRFHKLGTAKVTHDLQSGFVIEGEHNGAPYRIERTPDGMDSLHIEYDHHRIKPLDCYVISTTNDSFYCYPSVDNIVTKLGLATEELHKIKREQIIKERAASKAKL